MTPTTLEHDRISIANAPCSFGAFDLTVGVDASVPDALSVLDGVSSAGYRGIDLGPVGYLGVGQELLDRLTTRGLLLAGGYLELEFVRGDLPSLLANVDSLLDIFDCAPSGNPPPRPTLADAGSPVRRQAPACSVDDRSLGWSFAQWKEFADQLKRVCERCQVRGYEPTFHHHTGTYVEAPWEIERLLELEIVDLCFDTGHIAVVGQDPVQAISEWGGRINHFHLKDARKDVISGIISDGGSSEEIWTRRAFCELGSGDIPVKASIEALLAHGYSGWIVVEQDILPDPSDPPKMASVQQAANLRYLRELALTRIHF
jgi:inosose dehydratase